MPYTIGIIFSRILVCLTNINSISNVNELLVAFKITLGNRGSSLLTVLLELHDLNL
jgi:hypothetical protein